jgi:hypothetical protein
MVKYYYESGKNKNTINAIFSVIEKKKKKLTLPQQPKHLIAQIVAEEKVICVLILVSCVLLFDYTMELCKNMSF